MSTTEIKYKERNMSYPGAWGLDYDEVQGLCWLPYKGSGIKGLYKFSNGSQWEVTDVFEKGGFRAVLVKGKGKTILSFAGSDMEIEDWLNNFAQGLGGWSPYYDHALNLARSYPADVIVGHSLGGGLASYCSIYLGKKSATINPAPLNVNLISKIPIIIRDNLVVNYVVIGEGLYYICKLTTPISPLLPISPTHPIPINGVIPQVPMVMTRVGRMIWVASNGSGPVQKHLLAHLVGFTPPMLLAPGTPGNGQRTHTVQPGDWLSKIAITYYGDMNKWHIIYDHPQNRATIGPNPDLIKEGQVLVIP
jgi:hypothetical protein